MTASLSVLQSRIVMALDYLASVKLPSTTPELVEAGIYVNYAEIQLRRAMSTASELRNSEPHRRLDEQVEIDPAPIEPVALSFNLAQRIS